MHFSCLESVMSGKCGLVLQGQESRANVFPSEDGMYPLPHHLHMHRFGKLADKLWGGFPPYFDATSNFNFQVPRVNDLPANNWFLSPTMVAQRSPTPHCNNRSLPSPSANGGLLLLDQEINKIISQSIMKHQSQLAYNGSTCSSPWKPNVVQPMETQSTPQGSAEATRPSECKLFGFSLTDPPPVRKILAKTHVEGNVVGAVNHLCMSNNYSIENEVDQQTPASIKPAMAMQDIISTTTSGSEADKPARPHIGGRSCTKVPNLSYPFVESNAKNCIRGGFAAYYVKCMYVHCVCETAYVYVTGISEHVPMSLTRLTNMYDVGICMYVCVYVCM